MICSSDHQGSVNSRLLPCVRAPTPVLGGFGHGAATDAARATMWTRSRVAPSVDRAADNSQGRSQQGEHVARGAFAGWLLKLAGERFARGDRGDIAAQRQERKRGGLEDRPRQSPSCLVPPASPPGTGDGRTAIASHIWRNRKAGCGQPHNRRC